MKNDSSASDLPDSKSKGSQRVSYVALAIVSTVFLWGTSYHYLRANLDATEEGLIGGRDKKKALLVGWSEVDMDHDVTNALNGQEEDVQLTFLKEQNKLQAQKIKVLRKELLERMQNIHDIQANLFRFNGLPETNPLVFELRNQLNDREDENRKLQEKIAYLENEFAIQDKKITHLQVTKDTLAEHIKTQQSAAALEVSNLRNEISNWQNAAGLDKGQLERKARLLETSQQNLAEALEQKNTAIKDLQNELATISGHLGDKDDALRGVLQLQSATEKEKHKAAADLVANIEFEITSKELLTREYTQLLKLYALEASELVSVISLQQTKDVENELSALIDLYSGSRDSVEKQLQEVADSHEAETAKLQILLAELDNLHHQHEQLQSKHVDEINKNSLLENDLAAALQKLSDKELDLSEVSAAQKQLDEERNQLTEKYEHLLFEHLTSVEQTDILQERLKSLAKEASDLESQLYEMTDQVLQKDEKLASLQNDEDKVHDHLQLAAEANEADNTRVAILIAEFEQVNERLIDLQEKHAHVQNEKEFQDNQLRSTAEALAEKQVELDKIYAELDELKQQHENVNAQNGLLHSEFVAVLKDLADKEIELHHTSNSILENDAQRFSLLEQIEILKSAHTVANEDNEAIQAHLKLLAHESATLESGLEKAQAELLSKDEALQHAHKQLIEKESALEEAHQQLLAKHDELKAAQQHIQNRDNELTDATEKLSASDEALKKTVSQYAELQSNVDKHHQTFHSEQTKTAELEDRLAASERQLAEAESTLEHLTDLLGSAAIEKEEILAELVLLKDALDEKNDETHYLKTHLERTALEASKLEEHLGAAQQKLEHHHALASSHDSHESFKAQQENDEQMRDLQIHLDQVNKHLEHKIAQTRELQKILDDANATIDLLALENENLQHASGNDHDLKLQLEHYRQALGLAEEENQRLKEEHQSTQTAYEKLSQQLQESANVYHSTADNES